MDVDPTWLRSLASAEGLPLSPSVSIRPALAEQLLAVHAQRVKRRSVVPRQAEPVVNPMPADGRHLADVVDEQEGGSKPYQVIGRIGSGGMGVVHLARQRSTGREVAIKAVHPDRLLPAYLAAFRQECCITAVLEHPNVPPVYDAGADFMVMKRLTGRSLEDRLRARDAAARLPAHIEALLKVCDAIGFAHARGVVHRDLKGENVMVGDFGEVWVMDWGLAVGVAPSPDGTWLAPQISSRQDMCAGTPMCVAPEVALAELESIGPSLDLFMLGALLYRVLCGHYPFEAKTSEESLRLAAKRNLAPLLLRAPGAPFRLVQAADRATAWDPGERGDLATFAADLRTWLHSSGAATDAKVLLDQAAQQLARGAAASTTAERYAGISQAISDAERASQLCPELRDAHELVRRARSAFAAAARLAGDVTLADLVQRGFAPPTLPGRR